MSTGTKIVLAIAAACSIGAAAFILLHFTAGKAATHKAPTVTTEQAVAGWAQAKLAGKGTLLADACKPYPGGKAGQFGCVLAVRGNDGSQACVGVVVDVAGSAVKQEQGVQLPAADCAAAPGWK